MVAKMAPKEANEAERVAAPSRELLLFDESLSEPPFELLLESSLESSLESPFELLLESSFEPPFEPPFELPFLSPPVEEAPPVEPSPEGLASLVGIMLLIPFEIEGALTHFEDLGIEKAAVGVDWSLLPFVYVFSLPWSVQRPVANCWKVEVEEPWRKTPGG